LWLCLRFAALHRATPHADTTVTGQAGRFL
jgi:hypothetical protein